MALALAATAQDTTLSLEEALQYARQSNGTVTAAYLNYEAAQAAITVAEASLLPTVSLNYTRSDTWVETLTGPGRGSRQVLDYGLEIGADYRIWDNGTRRRNVQQARLSAEASALNALQTLRDTLFQVHTAFYDTLRAQQLQAVQELSVERAQSIYEQTEFGARPEIGEYPQKDVLQARADLLNAQVSLLEAANQVASSEANLRAVIGYETDLPQLDEPESTIEPLPVLEPEQIDQAELQSLYSEAVENRADLESFRKDLTAQEVSLIQARRDTGVNYSLDASVNKSFGDSPFNTAALVFSASLPVYDGKQRRELLRIEELRLESLEAQYAQLVRNIEAEIESAYTESSFNARRLSAATVALEAAQLNYDAAISAQREGAGTLIEVLTAQVSLTTAEANLVNATYDALISDVRLRLAVGRPLPAE